MKRPKLGMPYLLRKIRRVRWDPQLKAELQGCADDDCPSDCLVDLKTADCALSLWHVEDDKSNLNDVAVALATNCDNVDHLDYALVAREEVEAIGLLQPSKGATAHRAANEQWHWNLVNLTARRVAHLAYILFRSAERVRVSKKEMVRLIRDALVKQKLDRDKMKFGV